LGNARSGEFRSARKGENGIHSDQRKRKEWFGSKSPRSAFDERTLKRKNRTTAMYGKGVTNTKSTSNLKRAQSYFSRKTEERKGRRGGKKKSSPGVAKKGKRGRGGGKGKGQR